MALVCPGMHIAKVKKKTEVSSSIRLGSPQSLDYTFHARATPHPNPEALTAASPCALCKRYMLMGSEKHRISLSTG